MQAQDKTTPDYQAILKLRVSEMEKVLHECHNKLDKADETAQRLEESVAAEQALQEKNSHLERNIARLSDLNKDLEDRLEQVLVRWKKEKELCEKETARCARLTSKCSDILEHNTNLQDELARVEHQLSLYDDLPVPVRQ
jgi:DNA repair exonuclease SbcCD ATPase subunit